MEHDDSGEGSDYSRSETVEDFHLIPSDGGYSVQR